MRTATFVCDKRRPGVIVSGVWPPIPIDEWQLAMDPRKVEEFRKKSKKDMKAALQVWDRRVGSPRNEIATTGAVREGGA